MKISKLITTILGCALMLAACGESTSDINNLKPDNDVIDIDDIVIDDDDDEEEQIITKTCKEITAGMCGGSLTDFLVGSYIEPNYTYDCSFSHEKTFSGEYTIKSDDRTIAQVTHVAGSSAFTIKGITPGDAIIQAVTEEDEVVLQFVVHVRKRVPMDKIAETLYNVDYYSGMFYGYKLSFIEKDPLKGTLVGNDDFESTYANFNLIDGVEEKIGNGTDFNTYKFRISIDTEHSQTSRTYTYLYVSTTGDKIYMYYTNGIVDIFSSNPQDLYHSQW